MTLTRRFVLSSLGAMFPFGLNASLKASPGHEATAPTLRLRPFEELVREAFADRTSSDDLTGQTPICRRVEIGHSDQVRVGLQSSHNDRPFAGFPEGSLRIIRTGSEPGPVWQGVRLHVSTVDIALGAGFTSEPSRPLNFATLPPAPTFTRRQDDRPRGV